MKSSLTVKEAAKALGLGVHGVRYLIRQGKLPARKVKRGVKGWKYKIDLKHLVALVRKHSVMQG